MKIKVTDAIDVGEVVWKWAEIHPEAKKDFRIMYEYVPDLSALRLTMERAYADETEYGMVRLLPEDILCNMVCPSDYINAALEDMYKKLMESEETERKEMGYFAGTVNARCTSMEDNDVRLKMAKKAVVKWYNEHNQPYPIGVEDVYIVWFCNVLQNWKALAGTHHDDGMYYEITFDGNNKLVYFDAYKKWQNVQMPVRDLKDGVC